MFVVCDLAWHPQCAVELSKFPCKILKKDSEEAEEDYIRFVAVSTFYVKVLMLLFAELHLTCLDIAMISLTKVCKSVTTSWSHSVIGLKILSSWGNTKLLHSLSMNTTQFQSRLLVNFNIELNMA